MAKKLKRKSARKVHRKSWFEKIFTFPVLVVAAFAVLSIITVYLITKPSHGVQGVSTSSLYEDVSDAVYNTFSSTASPKSVNDFPRYLDMRIFKDTNGDGKKQSSDTCPLKDYVVVINGVTKTKTQKLNCGWNHIDLGQEYNTVKFVGNLKNYTYSGMIYTDRDGLKHYTKERTISFSGGKWFEGGWYRQVSFGLKPK